MRARRPITSSTCSSAIVCSALGEIDRAFELLERGVRDHNVWIGSPRMPMFENFRKNPRYAEHLRVIGRREERRLRRGRAVAPFAVRG